MPKKPIDEDRARRKEELEAKRAARRAAKEKEVLATDIASGSSKPKTTNTKEGNALHILNPEAITSANESSSSLLRLPEVALQDLMSFLPAADLGRLTLLCKTLNETLPAARVPFLVHRLLRPSLAMQGCVGYPELLSSPRNRSENQALESNSDASVLSVMEEASVLLRQSLEGDTGRILPKSKSNKPSCDEFVAYARFLDESVSGYGTILDRKQSIQLPRFVQGRFASVSPEHSLCRVGGDGDRCGAGGSGVASWGVGRRGQLGHGKRQDERLPKRLMGGIGYGVRIVQVSAGGGLVRVAHSLLLTDTGKVLSFGAGQYGALGHGYSTGKQLPDVMRPQYVQALSHLTVVCVAAGELHSAVVTSDGDVYSWGDGFCGQLGHGDKRPQLLPKQVVKGGLEDECVATVSCGSRHSIAVTEEGEVFTWGLGHFGCLGRSYSPFDYDADTAVAAFTEDAAVDENLGRQREHPIIVPAPGDDRLDPHAPDEIPSLPRERDYAAELAAHLDLIANLSLDDTSTQCIPQSVESLKSIKIVGGSAGHRHSLFLSQDGSLYSCGAGIAGCLGHGDTATHMYPLRITSFDDDDVRIRQMSAGVDMSMAVCSKGTVYAWGKADGGRLGLGLARNEVVLPRKVSVVSANGEPIKAVDVECGYVHSLIVGLDGKLFIAGRVGIEGEADGFQQRGDDPVDSGRPCQVANFSIWHRIPEPKEEAKKERWKKLGKYEVKGRTKMLNESSDAT